MSYGVARICFSQKSLIQPPGEPSKVGDAIQEIRPTENLGNQCAWNSSYNCLKSKDTFIRPVQGCVLLSIVPLGMKKGVLY